MKTILQIYYTTAAGDWQAFFISRNLHAAGRLDIEIE